MSLLSLRPGIWILSAGIVWTLVLSGLVVRFSCGWAQRAYAFNDYMLAGLHWMRGEYLYGNWRGFIYSPVIAAFFAPFSCLPPTFAYSLWLCANVAALLGGLAALFNTNLFPGFSQKGVGIVYLLLVPLGLGNLDVGQANPLAGLSQFLTRNSRKWLMLRTRYGANTLRLSPQIDFDRGRFEVVVVQVKSSRADGG